MPPGIYKRPSNEERFFAKINKTDTCWLWIAGVGSTGYGAFSFTDRSTGVSRYLRQDAHRYSYEIINGPIPAGQFLRHADICQGNRRCVNPAHLTPGTQQENVDDMVRLNRQAKGTHIGTSVLTEDQVRIIKQRDKEFSSVLANEFNVSRTTIKLIRNGTRWAHI